MSVLTNAGRRVALEYHTLTGNDLGVARTAAAYIVDRAVRLADRAIHTDLDHYEKGRVKDEIAIKPMLGLHMVRAATLQTLMDQDLEMRSLVRFSANKGVHLTARPDIPDFLYGSTPIAAVVKGWKAFEGNDLAVAHDFAYYAANVLHYRALKTLTKREGQKPNGGTDAPIVINGVKLRVVHPDANHLSEIDRLIGAYLPQPIKAVREEIADRFHRHIDISIVPTRDKSQGEIIKPRMAIATLTPLH